MTDMRATERLLEFIGEHALVAFSDSASDSRAATSCDEIMNAIAELKRRGDTLVRARDLALALDELRPHIAADDVDLEQKSNVGAMPHRIAFDRLQYALGGKL